MVLQFVLCYVGHEVEVETHTTTSHDHYDCLH